SGRIACARPLVTVAIVVERKLAVAALPGRWIAAVLGALVAVVAIDGFGRWSAHALDAGRGPTKIRGGAFFVEQAFERWLEDLLLCFLIERCPRAAATTQHAEK